MRNRKGFICGTPILPANPYHIIVSATVKYLGDDDKWEA